MSDMEAIDKKIGQLIEEATEGEQFEIQTKKIRENILYLAKRSEEEFPGEQLEFIDHAIHGLYEMFAMNQVAARIQTGVIKHLLSTVCRNLSEPSWKNAITELETLTLGDVLKPNTVEPTDE